MIEAALAFWDFRCKWGERVTPVRTVGRPKRFGRLIFSNSKFIKERRCDFCGELIEHNSQREPKVRFCRGVICRSRYYYCAKYGLPLTHFESLRTCVVCGRQVKGNAKRQTCSRDCQSAALPCREPKTKQCNRCGRDFETRYKQTVYCQDCCQAVAYEKLMEPKSSPCRWCGAAILSPGGRTVYCLGTDHREKAYRFVKRVRRGRSSTSSVRVKHVYDRDGGRCGICGKKVSKRFKYPDPQSPSVDHILALSLGGKDELVNTQLAHWGCNSKKRNKVGYQQLLFA